MTSGQLRGFYNFTAHPERTLALYSHLTGFDALLIDRVVYYKFTVILRFLCTRKYIDASSLKHVVFMQK